MDQPPPPRNRMRENQEGSDPGGRERRNVMTSSEPNTENGVKALRSFLQTPFKLLKPHYNEAEAAAHFGLESLDDDPADIVFPDNKTYARFLCGYILTDCWASLVNSYARNEAEAITARVEGTAVEKMSNVMVDRASLVFGATDDWNSDRYEWLYQFVIIYKRQADGGTSKFERFLQTERLSGTAVMGFVVSTDPEQSTTHIGRNNPMRPTKGGKGRYPGLGDYVRAFKMQVCFFAEQGSEARPFWLTKGAVVEVLPLQTAIMFNRYMRMLTLPEEDFAIRVSPLFELVWNPSKNPDLRDMQQEDFARLPPPEQWARTLEAITASGKPGLMCISGGPGAGKTTALKGLLFEHKRKAIIANRPFKVLALTPSNAAANVLARLLMDDSGYQPDDADIRLNVYRFADSKRMTYQVIDGNNKMEERYLEAMQRLRQAAGSDPTALSEVEAITALTWCDVVVSTLGSCHRKPLGDLANCEHFTLMVIDEAPQASQAELLLPMAFRSLKQGVIVGDPHQLGPVLFSQLVKSSRFAESTAFGRVMKTMREKGHSSYFRIPGQYRMRVEVADLVNSISYSHPDDHFVTDQHIGKGRFRNCPFHVFSSPEWHESHQGTVSLASEKEAIFAVRLVSLLLQKNGYAINREGQFPLSQPAGLPKIAILSMYKQHLVELRKRLQKNGASSHVITGTVDAFQGEQFDIVVLSCVRASDPAMTRGIGFTTAITRANVALSRGAVLYVLGHFETFQHEPVWQQVIARARDTDRFCNGADSLSDKELQKLLSKGE